MATSLDAYCKLKKTAHVVPCDNNYNRYRGEMNPEIARTFFQILDGSFTFPVVWEPFAGSSERSLAQDYARAEKVELISYDLAPKDSRIKKRDSMMSGPAKTINGLLFHPPYFGTQPFSKDDRDLSLHQNIDSYRQSLRVVISRASQKMEEDGFVCAVGRDYRVNGKRVRLDVIFLELVQEAGFTLMEVWSSIPDMVLLFQKRTEGKI